MPLLVPFFATIQSKGIRLLLAVNLNPNLAASTLKISTSEPVGGSVGRWYGGGPRLRAEVLSLKFGEGTRTDAIRNRGLSLSGGGAEGSNIAA